MYKLIYFFGPDGTGKSTHADLVATHLRQMGLRVWRTSVKQHHTLSYLLLRMLSRRNPRGKVINYCGFNDVLTHRIRTPWKILEIMSLFPAILYRIILLSLLGYIIICDRYVLDTLVSLSYFLKDPKLISGMFAKLMAKLIPNGSLLFYMNAETGVILKRKENELLTTQLIEYYRQAYEDIIKQLKRYGLAVARICTTTTSIKNVHEIILSYLSLNKQFLDG